VAEVVTVSVTVNGVPLTQEPAIAFVAGAVSPSSSVSVNPQTGVLADGADAATVTLVLEDAHGNPVSGLTNSDFAIAVTGSAQAGTVSAGTPPGTYAFEVTNTVAETVTVTVTARSVQLTQQPMITFVGGGVSASASTVIASPATGVTADGLAASTVTVTLVDGGGAPVTGLTSGDFVLAATGSAVAGAISEASPAGTYTFAVTNTVAETVTLTVTASGVQLTQQPTIGFVAGAVAASMSNVSAAPATGVIADGSAASTVTVTLADTNGNAVGGLSGGAFAVVTTGSAQASAVTESTTPGTYTFTVTDTLPETITVTVTADNVLLTQNPTIEFVQAGISALQSTVVANPATNVTADGVTASVVTVSVLDGGGNRVGGLVSGDFTVAVSDGGIAGSVTRSGPAGVFQFPVTDTAAETVTVMVTVKSVLLNAQPTIEFVPGAVSPASTVSVSPSTGVTADGSDASTVTVALRDAKGNPIGGLSDADFTITVDGVTTPAQRGVATESGTAGTYTFAVTHTVAEVVTVTVTVGSVQLTAQPTITFVP
jgi:hypothetical protein